jgi:hypothetical protein
MQNDNLRPLVFSWLIKILNFNKSLRNIENSITKYIPILLEYITKNNLHLQYQTLEFLLSISTSYSKALKGYENAIMKALLSIATDDNNQLLWFIYEILLNLFHNSTIDDSLIEQSLGDTVKLVNSSKLQGNALGPILNYLEICSKRINATKVISYLQILTNFPNCNLNQAKAIAILASSGGVEGTILKDMTNKVTLKLYIS